MAINEGKKIDDGYRNVSGIWPQIRRMESAYEGRTVMLPATRLFAETVALYRDNSGEYQRLLQEAESMAIGCKENEPPAPNPPARPDEVSETEPRYGGEAERGDNAVWGDADIEKEFLLYLKEEKHLAERSCGDYDYAIRKAERLAQKYGLSSTRLFTKDADEAAATACALFANEEFIQCNNEKHKNFSAAIMQLLDFYGIDWQPKEKQPPQTHSEISSQGTGKSARVASSTESLKDDFRHYLKEEKHSAEGTCLGYAIAITSAERFAQKHGLAPATLYTENPEEAVATADALFASAEFVQYMSASQNSFKSAIKSLLKFYGIEWRPKMCLRAGNARLSQDANHLIDAETCEAILKKHFCNGYHLSSAIDMKKFCSHYKELTGAEMGIDEAAFNAAISERNVVYGGKVYAQQSLLSDDTRMRIFSFIDEHFAEGRRAVYEKFYDELLDSNIRDASMLGAYLSRVAGKYFFGKKYLTMEGYADAGQKHLLFCCDIA